MSKKHLRSTESVLERQLELKTGKSEFNMMLPDTMIAILRVGGSLDIDCSKIIMLPATMVSLAQAAASSGARVTFRDVPILLPQTAVQVASAGRGSVTFAI